jgi:hypothetical protein
MGMRRMMKSHYGSIISRVLGLVTGILLTITLFGGCQDPAASNFETEHRRLSDVARQEIRQGLSAFALTSQPETFYPAP